MFESLSREEQIKTVVWLYQVSVKNRAAGKVEDADKEEAQANEWARRLNATR